MSVHNPEENIPYTVDNPLVVTPLQLFAGLLRPVTKPEAVLPPSETLPNEPPSVTLRPKNDIK